MVGVAALARRAVALVVTPGGILGLSLLEAPTHSGSRVATNGVSVWSVVWSLYTCPAALSCRRVEWVEATTGRLHR